jgi:hypothetical protein
MRGGAAAISEEEGSPCPLLRQFLHVSSAGMIISSPPPKAKQETTLAATLHVTKVRSIVACVFAISHLSIFFLFC